MEYGIYVSRNWYDIPERVVPIISFLMERCCQVGRLKAMVTIGSVDFISSNVLLSLQWLGATSGAGTAFFPEHLSSLPLLVEQEQLSFRSTWVHFRLLCGVRVAQSISFCVVFLEIIVCPFVFSSLENNCIACRSIYSLWLILWYLQTFLKTSNKARWYIKLHSFCFTYNFLSSNFQRRVLQGVQLQ